SHCQGARIAMFQVAANFEFDRPLAPGLRVDKAARTVALRIASLDDESRLISMERQAIVEPSVDQVEKVPCSDGSLVLVELHCDLSRVCRDLDLAVRHRLLLFLQCSGISLYHCGRNRHKKLQNPEPLRLQPSDRYSLWFARKESFMNITHLYCSSCSA